MLANAAPTTRGNAGRGLTTRKADGGPRIIAISENSTATTRRNLITGIAATSAAAVIPIAAAAATSEPTVDVEAVLVAWRTWHALGTERDLLTAEMVEICERFPEHVSKPRVLLLEGKVSKKQWYATTVEEIVQYYSGHEDMMTPAQLAERQLRRDAKVAELEGAKAIAEAELQRTGYAQLDDRCKATFEVQYKLEGIIENSTSAAPAVLVAKLTIALSRVEESSLEDFHWAMVRSAIANLLPSVPTDMAQVMAPIAGVEALS